MTIHGSRNTVLFSEKDPCTIPHVLADEEVRVSISFRKLSQEEAFCTAILLLSLRTSTL